MASEFTAKGFTLNHLQFLLKFFLDFFFFCLRESNLHDAF